MTVPKFHIIESPRCAWCEVQPAPHRWINSNREEFHFCDKCLEQALKIYDPVIERFDREKIYVMPRALEDWKAT